jgi:hypothetical protein
MRSIMSAAPRCSVDMARLARYSSTVQPKDEGKSASESKEVANVIRFFHFEALGLTAYHQSSKISGAEPKSQSKTQTQLDKELQEKMAGIAGDGGDAGLELEDGRPVSMKRSVKENMFRYI